MRIPVIWTLGAALLVAGLLTGLGLLLIDPDRPLIVEAGFDRAGITPNADGSDDAAVFSYVLARDARVTISLTHTDGQTFLFREHERRAAGRYSVLFSGVVDGFTLPGEAIEGEVERRLMPDGLYTWRLRAEGLARDEQAEVEGTLTVSDGDDALPLLTRFTVSPPVFTPNQDAVSDRVEINVFVSKPAQLTAYLVAPDGTRAFISPREELRREGEAGPQAYDYDGGIDTGAEPPPDGLYTVVVEAQDAVGQRVVRRAELRIEGGGLPRAEIVQQPSGADVVFAAAPYDEAYFSSADGLGRPIEPPPDAADARLTQVTVRRGDLLVFKLTVENYGTSAIRTAGPPPGTVYQQNQLPAALGESNRVDGAWRVAIECDTSETPYPYRWGIGRPEDLVAEADPTNDNVYYYLPPGGRSMVWGAVRLTDVVATRNPQECWVGLLHEGVAVRNNRVGARSIFIADTGTADTVSADTGADAGAGEGE